MSQPIPEQKKAGDSPESPDISGFIYTKKYPEFLGGSAAKDASSDEEDEEEGVWILQNTEQRIEVFKGMPTEDLGLSNPIVLGPSNKIHVPHNVAARTFKTAVWRKLIAKDPLLAERRDLILCVAEEGSDRTTPHRIVS